MKFDGRVTVGPEIRGGDLDAKFLCKFALVNTILGTFSVRLGFRLQTGTGSRTLTPANPVDEGGT